MEFRFRIKYQRIRLACRFGRGFMSWWLEVLVQVWMWWVWISTAVDNCFSPCLVTCAGPASCLWPAHITAQCSLSLLLPSSFSAGTKQWSSVKGCNDSTAASGAFSGEEAELWWSQELRNPNQGCWALLLPSRQMHRKGLPRKQITWELLLPSGSEC